jgi:glycosyltransferase involved in cell wall biosynthesis
MNRILIATDAWHPQVNGVVTTLSTTAARLRGRGHPVEVVSPDGYPQVPVPFYPEIRLALPAPGEVGRRVVGFRPDHVHIATEGPIGQMVRGLCARRRWRFTTSYHTRFPEYLRTLTGAPEAWSYRVMRWFHNAASAVLVATPSLERELVGRGFTAPIRRWSRGVDVGRFKPGPKPPVPYPRPVLLYVGRVSAEKGLDDFLKLDTPGTKVVVGDGPARAELQARYPAARFLGYRTGADLAAEYAAADLFVFPSRTDTFGIVLIEALASGLPVAAYPVTGPVDIITDPGCGALNDDLGRAVAAALAAGDPAACARTAAGYTWDRCTDQFAAALVPVTTCSTPSPARSGSGRTAS